MNELMSIIVSKTTWLLDKCTLSVLHNVAAICERLYLPLEKNTFFCHLHLVYE